jgi:hypothetical protein
VLSSPLVLLHQGRYRLVALTPSQDLFDCANDLFIAAMVDRCSSPAPASRLRQLGIESQRAALRTDGSMVLNKRISCMYSSWVG